MTLNSLRKMADAPYGPPPGTRPMGDSYGTSIDPEFGYLAGDNINGLEKVYGENPYYKINLQKLLKLYPGLLENWNKLKKKQPGPLKV